MSGIFPSPVMSLLPHLNLFSRFVLLLVVTYRAFQTRNKAWFFLMFAFFINTFDVESYILPLLGLKISGLTYDVTSQLPNFMITILVAWGGIHLKYRTSHLKHVIYLGGYLVFAYIWLFLTAASFFGDDFALMYSLPAVSFGFAFIYLGLVLREYVIRKRSFQELFPWGLILLGAINLTYPIGRPVEWYADIAFFLAAVFRFFAALGALNFVFLAPTPGVKVAREFEGKPGAFLFESEEAFEKAYPGELRQGYSIVITRKGLEWIKNKVGRYGVSFWLTRAVEGRVEENTIAISPTKIDILVDLVERELQRGFRFVYIDAFEYLMVENGFESAVKFLLSLKDRVMNHKGTLTVVVNTGALDERQRAILKREFEVMRR